MTGLHYHHKYSHHHQHLQHQQHQNCGSTSLFSSPSSQFMHPKNSDHCDLDSIRSDHCRRNSLSNKFDSIYAVKQYHKSTTRSIAGPGNDENIHLFNHTGMVTSTNNRYTGPNTEKRRKFMSQILPSKLIMDKMDDPRIENISPSQSNNVNRRRAADTYSPYGTRSFPSLRQRPTSTDSNASTTAAGSVVSGSHEYSSRRPDCLYSNGLGDDHNTSRNTGRTKSPKDSLDDRGHSRPARPEAKSSRPGEVYSAPHSNLCRSGQFAYSSQFGLRSSKFGLSSGIVTGNGPRGTIGSSAHSSSILANSKA